MNPYDQKKPIPHVSHIVAVGSGKGGVGKSTVSAGLAVALKKKGFRVGLLDADVYGPSIPRLFGCIQQKPDLTAERKIIPISRLGIQLMSMGFLVDENMAVVWRGPMLFKAMDQFFRDVEWGPLDYLIIDLPPGTGDIALTMAQKVPISAGITVTTPQNLALVDVKKAIDMFAKIGVPYLGMVENMSYLANGASQERIQLFPRGDLDVFLRANAIEKLAEIPFEPRIGIGAEAGIPSVETSPETLESLEFGKIAEKLIQFCNLNLKQKSSPQSEMV